MNNLDSRQEFDPFPQDFRPGLCLLSCPVWYFLLVQATPDRQRQKWLYNQPQKLGDLLPVISLHWAIVSSLAYGTLLDFIFDCLQY